MRVSPQGVEPRSAPARPTGVRRLAVPLVLLVLSAVGCSSDTPRAADPPPESSSPTSPATPWRTEVWLDLAVDVPADWDWGTGATDIGLGGPSLCGAPDPDSDRPYVGRPIPTSDVCFAADQLGTPRAPYVWLGAPMEPGSRDLGDGWVQETVHVEGTTLTVTSDDPELRRQVLGSARAQDQCGTTTEDASPPGSLCVYGPAGEEGAVRLMYATTMPTADADAFVRAVADAPVARAFCDPVTSEFVVVTVASGERYVVDAACSLVVPPDGEVVQLTDAARAPWARDGVLLVLRSEIGVLG